MAQAPFFTGRDSHFNAKSGVESRTPTIFGSLVDIYGTGFYLRPDSGTNVFRNSNMPTTGLICGASVSGIEFFHVIKALEKAMFSTSKKDLETCRVHVARVAIFSGPMRERGHSKPTILTGRRHR